jgi:hypothetical protein
MLAAIIPLGLGFLIVIVLLISFIISKSAGNESFMTQALLRFSKYLPYLIITIILMPYVILKIMQVYVSIKLKKKALP